MKFYIFQIIIGKWLFNGNEIKVEEGGRLSVSTDGAKRRLRIRQIIKKNKFMLKLFTSFEAKSFFVSEN